MLRFGYPEYLWLLLAIPALAVAFGVINVMRRRQLHRFVAESLVRQLAPDAGLAKRILKQGLVLGALAFLILAIADPLVGTRLEDVKREGIDLFVAMDVSLSMKAEDIRPSRLEKAKRDVSELLKKLSGDRVGLIVFAGDAFVQFPLTTDYSAADLFISAVDVDAVPVPGTMIGSAIELALKSFSTDLPTQKAIVVVSDGENTEGDVMGAVEDAKKAGVRIYSVGMGTPEGGPIPIYDQNGVRTDYKRDQSGNIVLTKLDESTLQQIAAASGGSYHRGTSAGNEIDDIFKELASLQKTEFSAKQVTGFEPRYQYPLAIALLLLIIDLLLTERRGRTFTKLQRFIPSAGLVLAAVLIPPDSLRAQTVRSHVAEGNRVYEKGRYTDAEVEYKKALQKNPKSTEAQFDLGNAYYKQQRFDEAAKQYGMTATDMKDAKEKAASLYNLGNTLYRANQYAESAKAYKAALRLNPGDDDARYNLLMALDKLKQQKQDQKQQKQDQKNQQKKQDQQKQNQPQQQNQQQQKNEQSKQDQLRQQQQKQQMPKDEAERILEAMKNNERDVQKQLHKRPAVRAKVDKDW